MKAAVENDSNGKEVMLVYCFDRRERDVQIAEGVTRAAAENPRAGKELTMMLRDRLRGA
jgi:hypothetical protein